MGGEAEGEKRESEGGTDKRVGAGERQRAKGERGAGVGVEWEGAAKNQKQRVGGRGQEPEEETHIQNPPKRALTF